MRIKFYCDLYVSDKLKEKKEKIMENLMKGRTQPFVYLITLAMGEKNHLEFYSSLFLKQYVRIYKDFEIFVAGLAFGYGDALKTTRDIVHNVYKHTGGIDIKRYLLKRQEEYEENGGPS